MGEPAVLVLPEVSITAPRAGGPERRPPGEARARLTNRSAGALRAAARDGAPPPSATGGFEAERTAQDEAEVRTAAAVEPAPRTTAARAGDAAEPPPSATGGFEVERTAQDEAEAASPGGVAPPRAVVVDPRTGVVATAAAPPGPGSVRTPGELVDGVRSASDAIGVAAPEPSPLGPALGPTVAAARARTSRGRGGGPAPRAIPVDPVAVDPVPKATATVKEALKATLPPLALPALATPPPGIPRPVLHPSRLPRLDAGELATTATDLATGKPKVDGKKVTDAEKRRRAKATAAATAAVTVTEEPPKPLDPPVLLDLRRPPPPPLPEFAAEFQQGQVTRVLAVIAADLPERARGTLQAVRDAAFEEGRLATYFEDVTRPWEAEVAKAHQAKLDELARAAGIGVETLRAAAQARAKEVREKVTRQVTAAELDAGAAAEALTKDELKKRATKEADDRRAQARRVQRLRLAMHSHDPALVDELVTERLTAIGADVASGVVAIDAAGKRRTDLLTGYEAAYVDAYRRADDAAQVAGRPAAGALAANGIPPVAPPPAADWATTAQEGARLAFGGLRTATTTATAGLVTGLTDAAESARAAVREWREKRLKRVKHDEHEQLRATTDREAVAQQVADARARAELAATRQQLVGEIGFVAEAALQKQQAAQGQAVDEARKYTEEQKKVAESYLAAGKGDPFVGVAEVMASRQRAEEVDARAPRLRETILARKPTSQEEASNLAEVYFEGGATGLWGRARSLRKAFEVWHGTAEQDAIDQLTGVSGPPMALLNIAYELRYKENLQWRINDEMSGSDLDMAIGLAGDDGSATAAESRQRHARGVIADSNGIFSNDSQRALDAVRALPPGEADAVVKDPATRKHLAVVLGGSRFDQGQRAWVEDTRGQAQLDALLAVNRIVRKPGEPRTPELRWAQARADAIEMDRYVRRGTGGDRPDVGKLFARIRADVLTDPESAGWSAEEVDLEVRRRTRDMEHAYQQEFGREMPEQANAMRTAMATYLWGTDRQLATDLVDVNRAGERATRLQKTTEGAYTSDSEMNAELARTYNDALAEVKRSAAKQREVKAETDRLLQQAGYDATRRPSPRELAAYRREATENVAGVLAKQWFADVDRTFGKRYAHLWGGDPRTALREMVTDTTQFSAEDEALARLEHGGGLTAAQQVQHGLAGWGLEKGQVMGGIGGRTKEQLARIGKEFRANTGEDMEAALQGETGDWSWQDKDTSLERDAFDFREALRGVATTPEEERAAGDRRLAYEENVYFANNPAEREMAVGEELADMRAAHARATAAYARYEAARTSGDPVAVTNAERGLRMARDGLDLAADQYREAVDAYVDRAAQIAAIAAAVLVTVVTWGAAGPVVIALAASVAGTAAAMATKQSLLGAAYSRHAMTNDLVVGVVDAVLTVLTARLGNVLLRLPKPTGTGKVLQASLKAIEAQRLAKPALARVGAFAAEQVAQSAPSAVTGAMLDRGTWKGDPVLNIAKAAGFASAVGVGVGGAMHGVSHGGKVLGPAFDALRALRGASGAEVAADRVLLRSTAEALARGDAVGDVLAHRGTPAERLAARREYLRRFPDRTPADFQAALREGTADALATADAQRALRREMLTELLDGIPPAERGRFLDTPVLVLSDAEFAAGTGSRSRGNAATLILHGEPVVVVREGAPLSALREEGMHVRQIRDVANAERVRLLDEERLARWGRASLEDRVAAWHAKLDLELEVQARTIADLDSRLAGAGPDRAATILRQYDDARAAFDVLSRRRRQLLDLDEAAMSRIRSGQEPAPHFLGDEPRLFSKSKAPPDEWVPVPGRPGEFMIPPRQRQPGPEFVDADGRRRRWVTEYDPRTRDFRTYEQVWTGTKKKGRWVMHGDAPRWSGGVGEIAMRLEHARLVGTDAAGVHRVQIDAQRGQGTGFDDVMPEFRTNAAGDVEATIVVYEAKYYRKSAGSFTAIDENFRDNLRLLKERLEQLRDSEGWEAAGMTRKQLDAALRAVDSGQIRVVVRTADTTTVSAAKLKDIQKGLRKKLGARVEVSRGSTIDAAGLAAAEDFWMQLERYRLEGYPGMTSDDAALVERLAARPSGVSPASLAQAEAVLAARRGGSAAVGPDVRWDPTGRFLVSGPHALEVVTPGRTGSGRFDPTAQAKEILARAGADVQPAGAATRSPVHVVVDLLHLTPGEVEQLRAALRRLARSRGRRVAYARTVLVNGPPVAPVGAAP